MAHALTLLRLLAAAPLAVAMAGDGVGSALVAAVALVVAIATDLADGPIARRRGTASTFGRAFDHTTDCIVVALGLSGAAVRGALPAALPAVIVLAFAQYVLDSWYAKRTGVAIAGGLRMTSLGRWNGILYFVPLVVDVVARLAGRVELAALHALLTWALPWLCWVLVCSTLVSMTDRATATWRLAGRGTLGASASGGHR